MAPEVKMQVYCVGEHMASTARLASLNHHTFDLSVAQ